MSNELRPRTGGAYTHDEPSDKRLLEIVDESLMPYRIKYFMRFADVNKEKYEIYIEQRSNEYFEIEELTAGENPFVVEIEGGDDVFMPIRTSTATISVLVTDEAPKVYSSKAQDYRVIVCKGDWNIGRQQRKIIWIGFVRPEVFTQPYNRKVYTLDIECYSTLASLEHVRYKPIDTREQQTLLNVFLRCLEQTSRGDIRFKCFLTNNIKVKEAKRRPWLHVLNDLYVSEATFFDKEGKTITAKDVLEQIMKLFNLSLLEFENLLYVTSQDKTGDVYRKLSVIEDDGRYKYKLYEEEEISDIDVTAKYLGERGEGNTLDVLPPINKVEVKASLNTQDKLISKDLFKGYSLYGERVAKRIYKNYDGEFTSDDLAIVPLNKDFYHVYRVKNNFTYKDEELAHEYHSYAGRESLNLIDGGYMIGREEFDKKYNSGNHIVMNDYAYLAGAVLHKAYRYKLNTDELQSERNVIKLIPYYDLNSARVGEGAMSDGYLTLKSDVPQNFSKGAFFINAKVETAQQIASSYRDVSAYFRLKVGKYYLHQDPQTEALSWGTEEKAFRLRFDCAGKELHKGAVVELWVNDRDTKGSYKGRKDGYMVEVSLPNGEELSGLVELTLLAVVWGEENARWPYAFWGNGNKGGYRWERNDLSLFYTYLSELKIEFVRKEDVLLPRDYPTADSYMNMLRSVPKEDEDEIVYTNIINEEYVTSGDDIDLELTSYHGRYAVNTPYSFVNRAPLTTMYYKGVGEAVPEEMIVKKRVRQRGEPIRKVTQLFASTDIKPITRIRFENLGGITTCVCGGTIDYKMNRSNIVCVELR